VSQNDDEQTWYPLSSLFVYLGSSHQQDLEITVEANKSATTGKAGGLTVAGPSKGPFRNRSKPNFKRLALVVFAPTLLRTAIPAKEGAFRHPRKPESRPFSGFRVALRLPGMTIPRKTYPRNCQTPGVLRQSRRFTHDQ